MSFITSAISAVTNTATAIQTGIQNGITAANEQIEVSRCSNIKNIDECRNASCGWSNNELCLPCSKLTQGLCTTPCRFVNNVCIAPTTTP